MGFANKHGIQSLGHGNVHLLARHMFCLTSAGGRGVESSPSKVSFGSSSFRYTPYSLRRRVDSGTSIHRDTTVLYVKLRLTTSTPFCLPPPRLYNFIPCFKRCPSRLSLAQRAMPGKSRDQRLLTNVHERVADARAADAKGTITLQHYHEADKAISEALDDLSFFGRSGASGENCSDPLQWAEPHDQPPQATEDLTSAFNEAVGQFQAMAAGHTGPLQDLMLDPAKRTELKSLFVGVGDEDLRQLLTEVQPTTSTASEKSFL